MKKEYKVVIWLSVSWVGVALVGYVDWITGYDISFFTFFFLPISISAWFLGFEASIATAFLSAFAWFGVDYSLGHDHLTRISAVWNTTSRLAAFLVIGWAIHKIRELLDKEQQLSEQLANSLSEIKVLEAFLTICCECKKIRDQDGKWQPIEAYIGEHIGTRFSHGYCPDCFNKKMIEVDILRNNKL
jgi:hypothetical protein